MRGQKSARDGSRHGRTLPVALAALCLGIAVGVGLTSGLGPEFFVGLVILATLSVCLALLGRSAESTAKRLTAGETSYRAFFDHAVEGIFRTTPGGHYLAVNQALADIYGYLSPEALMSGLTDIGAQLYVDTSRRDAFRELMQANDVVTDFVSEIYHRSGKRIWIAENARAVRNWSGELICYEGTVQDVTEKFEAERALRSALRQAELANRAKAAFLAAMSHELKTPLNAVLGFSEIIRDELLGGVGQPVYRDYAADIHASGMRLLGVINDVLDVTRLEGGLLAIEARPADMQGIAEQAIALARTTAGAGMGDGRAVFLDIAPDMPALHVDPRRFAQALGNLLSNAIKFTPEGGKIALTARKIAGGGASIAISDTGIGMAPEAVAAAFEPFRQLDGTLSRKFEGAGLGLSIARALVELHQGTLAIQSTAGEGTIVTVTLPYGRVQPIALAS